MRNQYAVVKIAHRQYIIEPNKTYTVDKFLGEVGSKVDLDVLALGKDEDFQVGKPFLAGKSKIEILDQGKGEKVVQRIYKAKNAYHRTRGHRKLVTTFKVLSII